MRHLVRALPRFLQDPLLEHRWFRRLWGGHFEQWVHRVEDYVFLGGQLSVPDVSSEPFVTSWYPLAACTYEDPAWHQLVRLRLPELLHYVRCEDHR